jgi:tetrahydromethanopterin S-methyltransferase subunit D
MRRFLAAALGLCCLAMAAYSAVTGVVVDATGNAVGDAMITYTNIVNRLVYVYSNQNGQFCIPDPKDWDLIDI